MAHLEYKLVGGVLTPITMLDSTAQQVDDLVQRGATVFQIETIHGTVTEVMAEQELTFELYSDGDTPYYGCALDISLGLVAGERYFVEWDGVTYVFEAEGNDTMTWIGNVVIMSDPSSEGDICVLDSGVTALLTRNEGETHTVRIYQATDDSEKITINPDCLPEGYGGGGSGGGSGGGDCGCDTTELEERVDTLESQLADLLYTAIAISSFSHNAGTQEMGATVTDLTLSWKTNKTPAALTLDGEALDVSATSKVLSGLSITKDSGKSWTLKATDERDATATKSTSISFLNGVYYGAAAQPEAIDSAFVLGLTKTLTSARGCTITVDAGAGEHIWYCLPTRLGACTFTVGGFEGGFDLVAIIEFTNASGFAENYYIYRSSQTALGSTKVVVS